MSRKLSHNLKEKRKRKKNNKKKPNSITVSLRIRHRFRITYWRVGKLKLKCERYNIIIFYRKIKDE